MTVSNTSCTAQGGSGGVLDHLTDTGSRAEEKVTRAPHTPLPWAATDDRDWLGHGCCYDAAITSFVDGQKETLAEIHTLADAQFIVEAVNSYASSQAQVEWQPIETAPKDAPVIVYVPVNRVSRRILICQFSYEYGWEICGGASLLGYPTHWMPLPAPPALSRKDAP